MDQFVIAIITAGVVKGNVVVITSRVITTAKDITHIQVTVKEVPPFPNYSMGLKPLVEY